MHMYMLLCMLSECVLLRVGDPEWAVVAGPGPARQREYSHRVF